MIKQAPTLDKKSKFGFLQLKREVTLADSFRLQILAALSLSLSPLLRFLSACALEPHTEAYGAAGGGI